MSRPLAQQFRDFHRTSQEAYDVAYTAFLKVMNRRLAVGITYNALYLAVTGLPRRNRLGRLVTPLHRGQHCGGRARPPAIAGRRCLGLLPDVPPRGPTCAGEREQEAILHRRGVAALEKSARVRQDLIDRHPDIGRRRREEAQGAGRRSKHVGGVARVDGLVDTERAGYLLRCHGVALPPQVQRELNKLGRPSVLDHLTIAR
jgi:hypothetical protein